MRRLKNADFEVDFFFIAPQVVRANPVVRGFPCEKTVEVALLESPNGLGATHRIASSPTGVEQKIFRILLLWCPSRAARQRGATLAG